MKGPKTSTVDGKSITAAGDPGNVQPCLQRETPEIKCATKARTGDTEVFFTEVFFEVFISSGCLKYKPLNKAF